MEQISEIQWVDTSHSQNGKIPVITLNKTVKLLIKITHNIKN